MDGSRSECLVAADQCPIVPSRLTNESEVWFLRYRGNVPAEVPGGEDGGEDGRCFVVYAKYSLLKERGSAFGGAP